MRVDMISHNLYGLPDRLITEMGVVTFEISGVSRVVLAQLTRHRTFSFSVQSMRYVEQDTHVDIEGTNQAVSDSFEAYQKLIDGGTKKQNARYVLPLATTTTLVISMPLKYANNYFMQRLHKSAQPEHRVLATSLFYNLPVRAVKALFDENDALASMYSEAYTKANYPTNFSPKGASDEQRI